MEWIGWRQLDHSSRSSSAQLKRQLQYQHFLLYLAIAINTTVFLGV